MSYRKTHKKIFCTVKYSQAHIKSNSAFLTLGYMRISRNITDTIRARLAGREPTALELDFPNVYDGARGVKFIEKVIESGRSDQKWVSFD